MSLRTALSVLLLVLTVLAGTVLWLLEADAPAPTGGVAGAPLAAAPTRDADAPDLTAAPALAERPEPVAVAPLALEGALDPLARVVEPGSTGSLRGRLLDVRGEPVAGEPVDLLVRADRWWTRFRDRGAPELSDRGLSDADGRFDLAARAGVVHELRAGGLAFARRRLEPVTAGDDVELVLERGLPLEGTVVDAETGAPLEGARVAAVHPDDLLVTESDARGLFRIEPVADRALVVGAWADGYDITLQEVPAPGWGALVVELAPGREVRGRVIDRETQQPLAGATVRWLLTGEVRQVGQLDAFAGRQAEHSWETLSDAEGHFVFADLPSRSLRLEVSAEGYLDQVSTRYEQRSLGPDDEVLVGLRPLRPVVVQVLDGADDAPVAGATVQLVVPDAVLDRALSDATGQVELSLAGWDDDSRVEVVALDGAGRHARGRLRLGDEPLVLRVVEPLALAVLVQDDGGPLAGAQVAVSSDGVPTTLATTGADGLARVSHLLAGPDPRRVHVQARHGTRQSLRVTWQPEDGPPPTPLIVDVALGAFYTGVVTDPYGVPVPGASVAVPRVIPVRTDDAGRFRLGPADREDDGPLRLSADAHGFQPTRLDGVLPGDDLAVVLEPVVLWRGRVLDAATGEALEGYSGRLLQQRLGDDGTLSWKSLGATFERTGVPGAFSVELPGPGTFQLAVGAPDYQKAVSLAVPFDGVHEPAPLDVVLSRAAVLELLLEDAGGRPVPGLDVALVEAERARGAERPSGKLRQGALTARADEHGRLRFQLGVGGRFRLASGPGAWLLPGELEVLPGLPVSRVVRVGGSGDLQVSVRDHLGRPLPGARLSVKSVGDGRPYSLRRRARGRLDDHRLLLETLPEGSYRVDVSHRSFATHREETSIAPGAVRYLEVTLQPPTQGEAGGRGGQGDKPKGAGGAGGGGGQGGRGGRRDR